MKVTLTVWRRIWAALALVLALNVVYQAGPGHADARDFTVAQSGAAAFEDHHPGDGDDGDAPHHLAGGHCASHCGGHPVKDSPRAEVGAAPTPRPVDYAEASAPEPHGAIPELLIRPPSA